MVLSLVSTLVLVERASFQVQQTAVICFISLSLTSEKLPSPACGVLAPLGLEERGAPHLYSAMHHSNRERSYSQSEPPVETMYKLSSALTMGTIPYIVRVGQLPCRNIRDNKGERANPLHTR